MSQPWTESMPDDQFDRMREILAAPSPVGLEAAMTYGVLKPYYESFAPKGWAVHQFRGNAGIVLDSAPGRDDLLSVMVIGHADKIRMQVRSVSDDGKIWIDSDSFLPTTLIGHEVTLFSRDPEDPGRYRSIEGGTVEALGAIHFADSAVRSGEKGIKKEMLYLELQIHGDDRKKQIEALGIASGDPIILKRPIKRGFSEDTFYGAYLDNGLGCFVASEVARLVAEREVEGIRLLCAIAAYEEIGRLGSRVLVKELQPDVVIGVDVSHDLEAAPGVGDRRFTPIKMGKGFTMSVGSIVNEYLNGLLQTACAKREIPFQKIGKGRDTGTDAMAAVFASVDAAATSLGFPIRNMHTISESGHTGDVLACVHGIVAMVEHMAAEGTSREDFRNNHPRLDQAEPLEKPPRVASEDSDDPENSAD